LISNNIAANNNDFKYLFDIRGIKGNLTVISVGDRNGYLQNLNVEKINKNCESNG